MDANERKKLPRQLIAGVGARGGSLALLRVVTAARLFVFARLFMPETLGTATLAQASVLVLASLANFGFNQSAIRSRDPNRAFTDTVFSLSLLFGLVVAAVIVLGAPVISTLARADITQYVRFLAFLALSIPLQFPRALLEKNIRFGHSSLAIVIPELGAFVLAVGIELAFHLGVWSLVIATGSGVLLGAAYIWIVATERPRLGIRRGDVRPIMSFGTPLMLNGLNGQFMARGDNLMVGAFSNVTQLAYYNFAWQLPNVVMAMATAIDQVLFPVYARVSDNVKDTVRLFNFSNKVWSALGAGLGFPLILYAREVVHLLYGPMWDPVVPILRVMAASFVIRFCSGYSYDNLVLVRGRTSYLMKWGFVNTALILTVCLAMIREMGPMGGAWFWVGQAVVMVPLMRFPLIRQEIGHLGFLAHVWQPFVSGLAAAALGAWILYGTAWTYPVRIGLSAAAYVGTYAGLFYGLDRKSLVEILHMWRRSERAAE